MRNVESWLEGSIAIDMVAVKHPDTVTLACMSWSSPDLVDTGVMLQPQQDDSSV